MKLLPVLVMILLLPACTEDITEEYMQACIRDITHPKRAAFCECSLAELRKITTDKDIIEFKRKGLTRAITLEQLDNLEEGCRTKSGYSYH